MGRSGDIPPVRSAICISVKRKEVSGKTEESDIFYVLHHYSEYIQIPLQAK